MTTEQLYNRIMDALEELQTELIISATEETSESRETLLLDQCVGVAKSKRRLLTLKDELLNSEDVKPKVVCLCGSTRFSEAFQQANFKETLAGNIVLTIGCDMRSDAQLFADRSDDELTNIKLGLDELHLKKIDMANEVLILNVDGYIGDSTRRELKYAIEHNKVIRYLEEVDS